MPPPSLSITVSRSGHMRRPCRVISSPVLPMTVISASRAAALRPRRNRAAPTPPASTVMRMADSLAGSAAGRGAACRGDMAGRSPKLPAITRHPREFPVIRNEAQRVRKPAAWLLLAAMALSVVLGVWTLLSAQGQLFDRLVTSLPGGGLNFGDRGLEAFGHFGAIYVTALPVAAVLLATLTGGKVHRAREITLGAAVLQAAALVLSVICWLAAFGSDLSTSGKTQTFIAGLVGLIVAVAGLMFTLAVLRAA